MKLEPSDIADLQPVIAEAVRAVLEQLRRSGQTDGERLSYTEDEAAQLLGVPRHVLRDERLRGNIAGSKIGKRVVYERSELMRFLEKKRL